MVKLNAYYQYTQYIQHSLNQELKCKNYIKTLINENENKNEIELKNFHCYQIKSFINIIKLIQKETNKKIIKKNNKIFIQ